MRQIWAVDVGGWKKIPGNFPGSDGGVPTATALAPERLVQKWVVELPTLPKEPVGRPSCRPKYGSNPGTTWYYIKAQVLLLFASKCVCLRRFASMGQMS